MFYGYEGNACRAHRRRDRMYIIGDILKATRRGAIKTEIMYKGGLSFAQLSGYLPFLVRFGLVEVTPKSGRLIYKTTIKGMRYLKIYEEIRRLLQEGTKQQHF